MTRVRVTLNHAALGEILKVNAADLVREKAEEIARNVDAQGLTAAGGWDLFGLPPELTATVVHTVTDRARSTVAINHPAALAFEAKHGVLTKAAGEAGLEVRGL